jgi:hypothetical protein
MKKRSFLVLSVITLFIASCGKQGGKSGLLVPKDAALVVHINSASLSSKLSWNEIKATAWFKKMHEQSKSNDSLAQQLLDDPSRSGIDTKKDFVMFMKKHGQGGYMVMEGSLTSQATYEQMLAEINKQEPKEIKKDGDFSYMIAHEKSVVVWNKSMFALVQNSNVNAMGALSKFRGGRSMSMDGYTFDTDSLKIFGEQALTLEAGQNLDGDSRFADLVKDGSDMHVWMNISNYVSGGMGNAMLNMTKAKSLLDGNITATSFNFDNGKISAHSKHYFSDELATIYSNNKSANVTADLINRIPSSDVLGVLAYNFSPTAMKDVLKATGMDAMADMFLSKVDFSVDDFVKAAKGDLLLAVSDPVVKTDTTGMNPSGKPGFKFLLATSVKDKAAFEKMVTLMWDFSKQMRKNPSDENPSGINYKVANDWFALSNSLDYTDKFLAGGANSKLPFTDKITGHPVGLYIDLQRILKFAGTMTKGDSTVHTILDASVNMWQDITATGGDYKDKSTEFSFEINLVDKTTNSLKQLNQYFDKIAGSMINKEKAMMKMMMDHNVPEPPADVK